MYRGAIQAIFSELVRQDRLEIVKSFDVKEPKTKVLAEMLKPYDVRRVLIITEEVGPNLYLAARNIPGDTGTTLLVGCFHVYPWNRKSRVRRTRLLQKEEKNCFLLLIDYTPMRPVLLDGNQTIPFCLRYDWVTVNPNYW